MEVLEKERLALEIEQVELKRKDHEKDSPMQGVRGAK